MENQQRQVLADQSGTSLQESRNMGSWSFQECLNYAIFLDSNKSIMVSKKKRKLMRIFQCMSTFLGTRNSLQCRSHHQKLLQKLGDLKAIIASFKKHVGKEFYRQQYQEFLANGKTQVCVQNNMFSGQKITNQREHVLKMQFREQEQNQILQIFPKVEESLAFSQYAVPVDLGYYWMGNFGNVFSSISY